MKSITIAGNVPELDHLKQMHMIELGVDAWDSDLYDQMKIMKHCRDVGVPHIVCTVRGYHTDPRELWQIDKVITFCNRLIKIGFVSYLDFSTVLFKEDLPGWNLTWGAFEVWLCATKQFKAKLEITQQMIDKAKEMLIASNAEAEGLVGRPDVAL